MKNDAVTIAIPCEKHTRQLDRTLAVLERTAPPGTALHILMDGTINVAEARQRIQDNLTSRYVCFLDSDSEMTETGWLESLMALIREKPDAVSVHARERWRGKSIPRVPAAEDYSVPSGPGACMLVDMDRVPDVLRWDGYIGLRSGWLGGDIEEEDWCYQAVQLGRRIYQADVWFDHADKKTFPEYQQTDRAKTVKIMTHLLHLKQHYAPDDRDFFKHLAYVKASITDDMMLHPTINSLRDCYIGVVRHNGLHNDPTLRKWGLT